ncbi:MULTISPECIES: CD1871A family CXXC motif-containing protein [unclassified Clostridioides]|nr:hypothetical protein [Clostridioides sp. ES-S-0001-02]MCC0640215.1 hypothetical protein [Clostridioides sp. ES-S-0049-03]MCC0652004.1 hypothetical protein [Clostridioides sp. ES-S-0001-03]MCC0657809.1 hypothetical protein [Clostridioides sp. ES-S-0123-01]MCC0673338.1 hypothetical protein [Clostridioides sp. ES-S-0145-01]MCC0674562.1 hypothetical protein [Clostridioides sp. ES-W-0018-02]MCC0679085.1 hypothetical protein [Clostridioides sp. ES-S-0005-03]MCC0694384.1 hypothetical protein [Cl
MSNFIKENKKGISIIVIGISFIVLGIYRGEANIVLTKAIMICLECIGIG